MSWMTYEHAAPPSISFGVCCKDVVFAKMCGWKKYVVLKIKSN